MQRAVERRNRGLERRRARDARRRQRRRRHLRRRRLVRHAGGRSVAAVQRAADGGQILVSDLVRALAGSRSEFAVDPIGEPRAQGPARADRGVRGRLAGAARLDGRFHCRRSSTPRPASRSRAAPRRSRRCCWRGRRRVEGTRRAVLVSGEPGIGKTRLVSELVRHAHEHGNVDPVGPVRRRARRSVRAVRRSAAPLRRAACPSNGSRAELGPLGGELTRMIPDLARLVPGLAEPVTDRSGDRAPPPLRGRERLPRRDVAHRSGDPRARRRALGRQAVAPVAATRAAFGLADAAARARDLPRHRPRPHPPALGGARRSPPRARRRPPRPRRPRRVGGRRRSWRRPRATTSTSRAWGWPQAVQQRDAGQPVLRRRGAAQPRRVGRDRAAATAAGRATVTLGDVGIPEGIREVVGRRLSRLSDAANRALAVAAVIGAQFDLAHDRGGRAARPATSSSTRSTRRCSTSIVREVPGAVGRYTFAHALVRSALYEELTHQPPRAHALAGRRSARGAATRSAPTRTSTSSRTTSAKARSPAIRSRRSSTAAAPASTPTPSSRSRAPRSTTTARWARSSSSTRRSARSLRPQDRARDGVVQRRRRELPRSARR